MYFYIFIFLYSSQTDLRFCRNFYRVNFGDKIVLKGLGNKSVVLNTANY